MKLNKIQVLIVLICSVFVVSTVVVGVSMSKNNKNVENASKETTSDIQTTVNETTTTATILTTETTVATTVQTTTKVTTTKSHKKESSVKQTKPNKPSEKPKPKPNKPSSGNGVVTNEVIRKINNEFLRLVNEERKEKGVSELKSNAYLNSCAQTRSKEITKKFSHERPNGKSFYTIIDENKYNYLTCGENICYTTHLGQGTFPLDKFVFNGTDEEINMAAKQIFLSFKNSPPHYSSMINKDFIDTGIGISYVMNEQNIPVFYVSHLFGTKQ